MSRGRVGALALAGVLALTACTGQGPTPGEPSEIPSLDRTGRDPVTAGPTPEPAAEGLLVGTLPDPVPGRIEVAGPPSPVSAEVLPAFRAQQDTQVVQSPDATSRAFQRLCVGEVDLVESARPISTAEWESCRAQGLDVVQLRVAADAVVAAIRVGSDVGTDCLDTDQLAQVLAPGDGLDSWSELGDGLADLSLRVAGPDPGSAALRSLGRLVLGVPEPTGDDLAADYRALSDEDAVRDLVAGTAPDRELASRYLPVVQRRRAALRPELADAVGNLADARATVTDSLEAGDDPTDAEYAARREAVAEVARLRALLAPVAERLERLTAAAARVEATTGTLGLLSYRGAAADPDLLRPFEIEVADDDGRRDCVLPTRTSIASGDYPLAHDLVLTATTRSIKRPEVADYLTFLLLRAVDTAQSAGLVPLPASTVRTQLDWIATGDFPVFASVDGGPVREVPAVEPESPDAPDDRDAGSPVEVPAR